MNEIHSNKLAARNGCNVLNGHTHQRSAGSEGRTEVDVVRWLKEGREILVALGSTIPEPYTVVVRDDATGKELTFRSGQELPEVGKAPQADHGPLSPIEAAIVEVLGAHEKLTGSQIASLAGYPYDTYLRMSLSGLRRCGLIGNKAPGYYLLTPPKDSLRKAKP